MDMSVRLCPQLEGEIITTRAEQLGWNDYWLHLQIDAQDISKLISDILGI